MLALSLARHGIEARVVDRLPGPSPYSRAVTVHARMLEIIEQIDSGLAATFLTRGVQSPGYVMHYVTAEGQRHAVRPGLDYTVLPSRYQFLLVNSQNNSEAYLREFTRERYGRSTEWGVTCASVQPDGDHALAVLEHADGRREQVRCRYIVACDGANSRIRRHLGLAQEGDDYAGTILQNLDVELLDFADDPNWMHYCMGPGHFVMVAKLPGKFFRLLMSQPAEKADASETPHHVFGGILAQHFDGVRFGETLWHSRWGSVNRLANTYRSGSVFLAGDAAHVHSTAGGQGMNCCMQDAWNLGWKLAFVIGGFAPDSLLDSYERERQPIGKQVIAAASSIHELFMAGRNSGPEALKALRDSGALRDLVGRVSGLSYHYRPEGASTDDPLPQAGDRMPTLKLANSGSQWLSDLMRHTGFTLLAALPTETVPPKVVAFLERVGTRYSRCLSAHALPRAPAELTGGGAQGQLYLVRPDGYVALRAAENDAVRIESWLESALL